MFTGAGMLDVAAMSLFDDASLAWHCENGRAASRVLAHHWPDVPNHGDVREIDWATTEPVDIITAGFPCQDVSTAGRQAGLTASTRSGLWSYVCVAIAAHRPRLVIIENVRGLLSAPAVRNMESGPDVMGDNNSQPVLRALGAVLGDLATLGFNADWTMLRASDVGACHHRARVFVLAYPADTDRDAVRIQPESQPGRDDAAVAGRDRADVADADIARPQGGGQSTGTLAGGTPANNGQRHASGRGGADVADTEGGRRERLDDGTVGPAPRRGRQRDLAGSAGDAAGSVTAFLPTPDTGVSPRGHGRRGGQAGNGRQSGMSPDAVAGAMLPTPDASAGTGGGVHPDTRDGHSRQLIDYALIYGSPRWGQYEPAIQRQERLSRPAPAPTEPNAMGRPRLNAAFAEWMMWWPALWVTDPAIGLTRIEQLTVIGNGVCPPQAASAFRLLREVAA